MSKRKKRSSDSRPPAEELEAAEGKLAAAEGGEAAASQPPPPAAQDTPAQVEEVTEEELRQQLEQARAEAAEYLDGWQRARAEFVNYKRRVERERQEQYARIAADIITRYLTILDDFELALQGRPSQGEAARWAEGIELIYNKLKGILEAEGIETIDPQSGEPFDPNLHEAVSHEESPDHKEGQIIQVLQKGYKLGDRMIRPARVRVAK